MATTHLANSGVFQRTMSLKTRSSMDASERLVPAPENIAAVYLQLSLEL